MQKTQIKACLFKEQFSALLSQAFDKDSRESLAYISSRTGKQAIVDLHVEGIIEYLEGNI